MEIWQAPGWQAQETLLTKTLCPKTVCAGEQYSLDDRMPRHTIPRWTTCPIGQYAQENNILHWTMCSVGQHAPVVFLPVTTCAGWHYTLRLHAPVDDLPQWTTCPGEQHAPVAGMPWWKPCLSGQHALVDNMPHCIPLELFQFTPVCLCSGNDIFQRTMYPNVQHTLF